MLEHDVVPTFYERGADGLPRRWLARMKASIGTLSPFFNTHRMVQEYTERFYLPAAASHRRLTADGTAGAKALAAWKARVQQGWSQVHIEAIEAGLPAELQVGRELRVQARVRLGILTPDDVRVELLVGQVNALAVVAEGARYDAEALMVYFREHQARIGFELRVTTLGHVQRGGAPTAYDRLLATRLGAGAVAALARGETGVLVGMIYNRVTTTRLAEIVGVQKPIDPELFELSKGLESV